MDQPPGLEAVLFDFDGTLARLAVDWDRVREDLRTIFSPYRVRSEFRPLLQRLVQAESALVEQRGRSVAGQVMAQAWGILREVEMRAAASAEPAPGVDTVWGWLRERGVPVGIVSNNHGDAIRVALSAMRLAAPRVIIGREKVRRFKPDAEGAVIALDLLGSSPLGTWMVGDSNYDAEVAATLGLRLALVGSAQGADAVEHQALRIKRLDELITIWSTEIELG